MTRLIYASGLGQSSDMNDDISAVAAAYRSVRESGGMDLPARDVAERVYRERHPEAGPELSRMVAIMIHKASVNGMLWPRRS